MDQAPDVAGDGQVAKPSVRVGRLMARARAMMPVASVGIVVAAVFFISLGATAWWAVRSQQRSAREGRARQVDGIAHVLSQNAEALLAKGDLSAVRRIVSETAHTYGLTQCQILLPDGQILADATAKNITAKGLPESWTGRPGSERSETDENGMLRQRRHLVVAGRGTASLDIAGSVVPTGSEGWLLQAKIGAISIGALAVLLVLHRVLRQRIRAFCAVREALLAMEDDQEHFEALQVSPTWGREAEAWNQLMRTSQQQREQLALQQAGDRLRERRAENTPLQAACNALWQGLILVNKDLQAEYVNGAAAALLQTQMTDLEGADISGVIDDERVLEATRAAVVQPKRCRTVLEVERDNGETPTVLRFVVRPVRREDPGVAMIVIEDITQQRLAEHSRGAFIANATHELRTPLTNIRLYAETALDDAGQDLSLQAKCLDVINGETHRLERMVADILSVTQIEAGTLSLRRDDVRLVDLFADLQKDYALQAKEKQVELAFNLPPKLPVMHGDREKIAVVLHNLLSNAFKYTPAGGTVSLNVSITGDELIADVVDTGIGISESDAPKVFEKFYRAQDARLKDIPGSGLGLAIAREVVRLHGGDLTVQSQLNRGSTFTLSLPLGQEAA